MRRHLQKKVQEVKHVHDKRDEGKRIIKLVNQKVRENDAQLKTCIKEIHKSETDAALAEEIKRKNKKVIGAMSQYDAHDDALRQILYSQGGDKTLEEMIDDIPTFPSGVVENMYEITKLNNSHENIKVEYRHLKDDKGNDVVMRVVKKKIV